MHVPRDAGQKDHKLLRSFVPGRPGIRTAQCAEQEFPRRVRYLYLPLEKSLAGISNQKEARKTCKHKPGFSGLF